jgi:hypothetical protein
MNVRVFLPVTLFAFAHAAALAQQPARPPVAGLSSIEGVVSDSLHGAPLVGALVTVVGTALRATTDTRGSFVIDGVVPGTHSIIVTHPMLDTIGFRVVSEPFDVAAGARRRVDAHTPSPSELRATLCRTGAVANGGSILIGRVSMADTDEPAEGATVSLVFKDLNAPRSPERVRTGRVAATGMFAICGVPPRLEGNVQASLGGVTTANLPVKISGEAVATTMISIGGSSGGTASMTGKVTTKGGAAVEGAQVTLTGTTVTATTAADGSFTLAGLPQGTREIVVRKIGFAQRSQVVTLSARQPASAIFVLDDAQVLKTVTVKGKLDDGLAKVGFTARQQVGMGRFLTPDEVEQRFPVIVTDALRGMAGIKINSMANGQFIETTRGPAEASGSCLNIFLDRVRFEQINPGDVDAALPAAELAAVEYYGSVATTPAEFQVAGKTCSTLVLWSKTAISRLKP